MTTLEFKPLRSWPRPLRTEHEGDQFQATYTETLDKLRDELRRVGAEIGTILVVSETARASKDGPPMAGSRMAYPGVVLRFVKGGSVEVEIATDKYADWKSNLRGIALSLEALRGINRWGCSEQDQQYLGFPALPPPDPDALDTAEAAARFVARLIDPKSEDDMSRLLLDSPAMFEIMFPQARKRVHPDGRNGEGHDDFIKVQKAGELLRAHYTE